MAIAAPNTIILHVEDDANDTLLFEHACRKAGACFDLKRARDGEEAIAYLCGADSFADRQRFPLPQLLLLDLKMPKLSGFEVLEWVRHQEILRGLPIIILSSSSHDSDIRRAYDLGANSYLVKPVEFEALVEVARRIQSYWLSMNGRPAV